MIHNKKTKKIYPICSFLSERHDTETLRHWLAMFLRCEVQSLHEVVVDMSVALMSACVQAFTSMASVEAYSERWTNILGIIGPSRKDNATSECYIRRDVAHVLKMFSNWKCFKGCFKITKQFYVRCLAQLLHCSEVDDLRVLLKRLITVAF